MVKRNPVASGSFYAAGADDLKKQIEECFLSEIGPGSIPEINPSSDGKITALVCPHAGYVYSGAVAACAYHRLAVDHSPEKILLIGPNHTGYGEPVSMYPEGQWQTPLGNITVDNSISHGLGSLAREDELAHRFEHSLEVQLPFLQYLYGNDFRITAITLADQSLETTSKLADLLLLEKDLPLIIASSDLSHYESKAQANAKDMDVIKQFESKNTEMMYDEISAKNISACGPGAIALVSILAKKMNNKIEVVCYKTSGDVTGDESSVVGYMSAVSLKGV